MGSSERFSRRAAARALVALAASLALSLGPSCVFETAGIEVPLRVLVRDGASGGALSLRRFDLSVTGVELLPCGPDVALAAPWRARFARALGPSVAHAHERGTPLYVTGGAVLDLAPGAETPAVELGAFAPPPGAYCSVRVQFAPSDEHSLGVDRDPGGLLRTTLRADGTDPATGEPFETRSVGSASVALALAAPLRLSDRFAADRARAHRRRPCRARRARPRDRLARAPTRRPLRGALRARTQPVTAAPDGSGTQRALDPVWLVRLRWAAIAAQLASVAGTRYLLRAPFPVEPLAAIVAALALANVWLSYSLRRGHRPSTGAITAQLLLDVAALTGLLVWTGGAMNPFTTLYLLHVALAAILVPRRHSLAVTLAAALAFGGLLLARPEAIHVWHSAGMFLLHVRGMWIAFALTALCLWYFVERVSEALQARERELSRARTEAERAERMVALGTLAAGAAHELNNPLGTMAILAAELAEVLPAGGSERARADAIRAEVKRCGAILSRLRARADESAPRERIELVAWLGARVEELVGGEIPTRIDAPPELWALGYRDELAQALGVLVDNARRADPGGPVEFTLARDGARGVARLRVRDRGAGVDPAHLQRLGDPFFTTRAPGEGMGLGLFFARAVAARHGGALAIERAEPGTAVTLELPLDSSEPAAGR